MIVGFAFLLLLPLVAIFYSKSSMLEDEVVAAQATKAMSELTAAIDTVYYLGPPARETLQLRFPNKIVETRLGNGSIVFVIDATGGIYEYTSFVAANLTGELLPFSGLHRIILTASETSVDVQEG